MDWDFCDLIIKNNIAAALSFLQRAVVGREVGLESRNSSYGLVYCS